VEAHIARAMNVGVELDQGEKEESPARIAATFRSCIHNHLENEVCKLAHETFEQGDARGQFRG
jgi:hypothetical protein